MFFVVWVCQKEHEVFASDPWCNRLSVKDQCPNRLGQQAKHDPPLGNSNHSDTSGRKRRPVLQKETPSLQRP